MFSSGSRVLTYANSHRWCIALRNGAFGKDNCRSHTGQRSGSYEKIYPPPPPSPPRTAAEINEALKEAGFVGELRDSDGDTLFGSDHLTRGQTYILHVVPGMLLYCVLALPERTGRASFCF